MHWHTSGEWAYVIAGSARVQAINEKGETFIDDVKAGGASIAPPPPNHCSQGQKLTVD